MSTVILHFIGKLTIKLPTFLYGIFTLHTLSISKVTNFIFSPC